MAVFMTMGAQCMCSFGTTPAALAVTSQQTVLMEGKPVATITDCQPVTNLPPFGMCTSMTNPAVAAATAAAMGVLTPQPCTMAPAGPWRMTQSSVALEGKPCLMNDSSLICSLGMGNITPTAPGQTKVISN